MYQFILTLLHRLLILICFKFYLFYFLPSLLTFSTSTTYSPSVCNSCSAFHYLRKVTKSLCLRNNTLLPVAWSLSGLEVLGEEFTMSLDRGVIQPQSEYSLQVHFRASRPTSLKKPIRLEVRHGSSGNDTGNGKREMGNGKREGSSLTVKCSRSALVLE